MPHGDLSVLEIHLINFTNASSSWFNSKFQLVYLHVLDIVSLVKKKKNI